MFKKKLKDIRAEIQHGSAATLSYLNISQLAADS